jgi:hypothetical protein
MRRHDLERFGAEVEGKGSQFAAARDPKEF